MRELHHWVLDPFSRSIRMALAEKKLSFSLIDSSPFEDESPAIQLNPIGGAPVLIDEVPAGRVIVAEPRSILEYLEETYTNTPLMPRSVVDRAEVRWVMGWLERGFDADVNRNLLNERILMRYVRAGRPNTDVLRDGAKALNAYLKHVEALTANRSYIGGSDFSLADICVVCHLSCLDYFGDVVWNNYKYASEWYVRMKSRASFREILNDVLEGVPPAPHYNQLDF